MSDLLARLRALQGASPDERPAEEAVGPAWQVEAAALDAVVVGGREGVHLLRRAWQPPGTRHGVAPLGDGSIHPFLERWADRVGVPRVGGRQRVVYVDTETTGLAGGTGTYVFLAGVGVHDDEGFLVEQLLLPGPQYERAWLHALAERLAESTVLVTFNGASFDVPLLRTRFALHGVTDPTEGVVHVDLLPLARRWWGRSLVNCTLGTIEREVLGVQRSQLDVPGAEVPARYRAYLRTRDATLLEGVVTHNVDDIVALAALQRRLEASFDGSPGTLGKPRDAHEGFGVARWLEALGEVEEAARRHEAWMEEHDEAAFAIARIWRREGNVEAARGAWTRLAERGHAEAWVELAKLREHVDGDFEGALEATERAGQAGGGVRDDLARREARLKRRLARREG